jgi:hypothetical protein
MSRKGLIKLFMHVRLQSDTAGRLVLSVVRSLNPGIPPRSAALLIGMAPPNLTSR